MRDKLSIIKKCKTGSLFNKNVFMDQLGYMSEKEFAQFCNEIIELELHKENTVGLLATDKPEAVRDHKHLFFVIK